MYFELYKDKKSEWRWRLIAKNKKVIAVSGEGYKEKRSAVRMIGKIILLADTTTIKEIK